MYNNRMNKYVFIIPVTIESVHRRRRENIISRVLKFDLSIKKI